MKKLLVLIVALGVVGMCTFAYANGIVMSSHYTAKHVAGMNDNTGDETAMYDPASTAWLKDGIYINVSNLTVLDSIEEKNGTTYEGSVNAWAVPSIAVTYKQAEFAGFVYFNVLDGAPFASLKWDDGTAVVNAVVAAVGVTNVSLEAESATYNVTLGGSYKINDMFSVALGGRYVISETTSKWDGTVLNPGDASQETTETANGFGGVIGFNVVPTHGWLIGLTYATAVKREFEIDQKATHPNALAEAVLEAEDGEKVREDLPAMATLTVAGMPVTGTIIALQVNYIFNNQADWEGAEDDYDNDIIYMLALTQYLNPQLRFSLGLQYAYKGTKDDYVGPSNDANPALDEIAIGIGGAYSIDENLNVGLSYSYTFFMEGKIATQKLNKDRNVIGVQVGYKI